MTENAMNNFKSEVKTLLTSKGFESFSKMSQAFEKLSLEEKIEALNFIASCPRSQRKTLVFSAFVKQQKKKISREINQFGFMI